MDNNHEIFSVAFILIVSDSFAANLLGHPHMGHNSDDQSDVDEGGHGEDPEARQDVQGGLVDQPKDLANFFRLHQLGHGGPGGGEDVVEKVVCHYQDDKEGPDLRVTNNW